MCLIVVCCVRCDVRWSARRSTTSEGSGADSGAKSASHASTRGTRSICQRYSRIYFSGAQLEASSNGKGHGGRPRTCEFDSFPRVNDSPPLHVLRHDPEDTGVAMLPRYASEYPGEVGADILTRRPSLSPQQAGCSSAMGFGAAVHCCCADSHAAR